jgi:hypothetical protein
MTSEVFVYLTLPGQTSSVTAGRFALDTDRQGNSVGRFIYKANVGGSSPSAPTRPFHGISRRHLRFSWGFCGGDPERPIAPVS